MKPVQDTLTNHIELINMPLAVDLIRFEKNLLQMGFFGAHDTRHSNQTSRRIEQLVNRRGQKMKVAAEFRASQEFGLPSTSDRDKYIAFMRIAMDQKLKSGGALHNPVRFTGYQLLKELGLSFSGENYEDINRWGKRMVDTSITSEQVIYLAARKKYADQTVHVFRSFKRSGQSNEDGSSRTEAFEVMLEDWLLENLNQSYVVPEDFNAYRKLKRPTAKGVFGYLHLWFYASQGREVTKDYSELCILLNVPSYKHVSKIKETMGRSLDELISIGYLAKWAVKPMATKVGYKLVLNAGDELLGVLAATQRKQLGKDSDIESQNSDTSSQDRAIELLIDRGVTAIKAKDLAQSHGEAAVNAAVQYTDSLLSGQTRRKLENPAGFIIYLLENRITVSIQQRSERTREDYFHNINPQARYEEFVNSQIDNAITARYPGESLTKRLRELVKEHSSDPAFKTLPPNVQTILAERILRDEVATELNLPKFEDWNRREQFAMF